MLGKLIFGNPWVFGVIGAVILVLGVGNIALYALWGGAAAERDAARLEVATITADRDAQRDGLATAKAALKRQQERMDENDAKARAALDQQQASARSLAVRLQSATDQKNLAIAQLQEEIDARPLETITVSVRVPDGWDPVVVAGMRRLRCVQLAGAEDRDAADCRIPADPGTGRSGLAGDPAGAAYPRPSARQQLDFLAFAWSLREWGAACYADKRAIAESHAIGVRP